MDARRNLVDSEWSLAGPFESDALKPANALQDGARMPGLEALTAREREVVDRAVAGNSNKSIAFDLGIADATVRVLLWRAYGKLGVRTRRELVAKAFLLTQLKERADARAAELDGGSLAAAGG